MKQVHELNKKINWFIIILLVLSRAWIVLDEFTVFNVSIRAQCQMSKIIF
jgi:hypothetical protein